MARQAINAPPAQPPLYSLLQAVDLIDDGVRWQQGVEWAPEQVDGGGAIPIDCHGGTPGGKPTKTNPIRNEADPFGVYAEDHCSTLGFAARDYEGRARRQLAAVQSSLIAREFQLGTIRDAESLDNVALIDATEIVPGGPIDIALGSLEAALADTFAGARSMIHVTMQTMVFLAKNFLIYQSGQKWLTQPGNLVVADAGYTDESGTVFMYGTSMVQVRLSTVDVVPPEFAQAVNRATNLVTIYAERLALVQLDHSETTAADLLFKVATDLTPWSAGS